MKEFHNRLVQAASPYLRQHADNPVHWWEWGEPALKEARERDLPILLSIGYSACHWCHVMAHESFADAQIAALMNRLFVNIKVDREERPDLDKIYQNAHQLLTRRTGGWPLTVFLMPQDQTPFFAGTYFPKQARSGMLGFAEVLQRISDAYQQQRGAIEEQNRSLRSALERLQPAPGTQLPDLAVVETSLTQLREAYDREQGGFGSAPKFPHPTTLQFLLRQAWRGQDPGAREMLLHTLQKMACGGVNDQLGGGFFRYSTDDSWMIPHFEKMLYDNGPLLGLYADAWGWDQHRPVFKHVCERTADWVMNEMQAAQGGYFSSLDADSEGGEGSFYVWQREQVEPLLSTQEYPVFAARYGLDRAANFEGRWHLHQFAETGALQERFGLPGRELRKLLRSARDKLLAERLKRARPERDEKILTSWNALMIRGMARAGRLLGRADWLASAQRAVDYLRDTHWQDGRLFAVSQDGQPRLTGYLDDYAFLLDALLEMLQARWDSRDLRFAEQLAEALIQHFEDPHHGGFHFTADDHEALLLRPKPFSDEAVPAGNAVAACALQRLGLLLGENRYLDAAQRTLQVAAQAIEASPYAHCGLLLSLQELLDPAETWIVRGSREALGSWLQAYPLEVHPVRQCFLIANDVADLPPALSSKGSDPDGAVLAYCCTGLQCAAPLRDPAGLPPA